MGLLESLTVHYQAQDETLSSFFFFSDLPLTLPAPQWWFLYLEENMFHARALSLSLSLPLTRATFHMKAKEDNNTLAKISFYTNNVPKSSKKWNNS